MRLEKRGWRESRCCSAAVKEGAAVQGSDGKEVRGEREEGRGMGEELRIEI